MVSVFEILKYHLMHRSESHLLWFQLGWKCQFPPGPRHPPSPHVFPSGHLHNCQIDFLLHKKSCAVCRATAISRKRFQAETSDPYCEFSVWGKGQKCLYIFFFFFGTYYLQYYLLKLKVKLIYCNLKKNRLTFHLGFKISKNTCEMTTWR